VQPAAIRVEQARQRLHQIPPPEARDRRRLPAVRAMPAGQRSSAIEAIHAPHPVAKIKKENQKTTARRCRRRASRLRVSPGGAG
jgi:hypothetical protein